MQKKDKFEARLNSTERLRGALENLIERAVRLRDMLDMRGEGEMSDEERGIARLALIPVVEEMQEEQRAMFAAGAHPDKINDLTREMLSTMGLSNG